MSPHLTALFAIAAALTVGCDGRRPLATDDAGAAALLDARHTNSAPTSPCTIQWQCQTDANGRKTCRSTSPTGGLPPAPATWRCSPRPGPTEGPFDPPTDVRWSCHSDNAVAWSSYELDPGLCGWTCAADGHGTLCEQDEQPGGLPAGGISLPECKFVTGGGVCWVCARGSALGGTTCERLEPDRQRMGLPVAGTHSCLPGQRAWCSAAEGGWGQVSCDAAGRWATREDSGTQVLDCAPTEGGVGPDTHCSCYFSFPHTSARCCERLDCVVPDGSQGASCAPSAGQPCDHCAPANPGCGDDMYCVTTDEGESFCALECVLGCFDGYACRPMATGSGTRTVCVPEDQSCYPG